MSELRNKIAEKLGTVKEWIGGYQDNTKADEKSISRREFGKLLGMGSAVGAGTLMFSDISKAATTVDPDFLSLDDGGDLRFGKNDDFKLSYDSSGNQLRLVGSSNVWSVSDGGSFNILNRDLDMGSGSIDNLGGIDGSISPTWTGTHTWTSGTSADDIVLDPNDSDNGAPSLNFNRYARQLFVTPDGATDYPYLHFGAKDFTGINYYIYKEGDNNNVLTFTDNDGDKFVHLNSDHSPKQVIFYQETEFYNSDIFDSNSNQTIWDSSSGHIPLSALDGESGSSGQVLTTDGTTASWGSVGGSKITFNRGYTMYGDSSISGKVPIWEYEMGSGETFQLQLIELSIKGETNNSNFTVEVYDKTNDTVLSSTSDKVTGSPIAESSQGATIEVRYENTTGSSKPVSINVEGKKG